MRGEKHCVKKMRGSIELVGGFSSNRVLGLVILLGFGDLRIQSLQVKSKSDEQFAANLQLNFFLPLIWSLGFCNKIMEELLSLRDSPPHGYIHVCGCLGNGGMRSMLSRIFCW